MPGSRFRAIVTERFYKSRMFFFLHSSCCKVFGKSVCHHVILSSCGALYHDARFGDICVNRYRQRLGWNIERGFGKLLRRLGCHFCAWNIRLRVKLASRDRTLQNSMLMESRNIGPWVGAPFRDALAAKIDGVAIQGVDPNDYSADLAGYVEDGGPQSCASSIASAITKYASACSQTKFVVSGWRLEFPLHCVSGFFAKPQQPGSIMRTQGLRHGIWTTRRQRAEQSHRAHHFRRPNGRLDGFADVPSAPTADQVSHILRNHNTGSSLHRSSPKPPH